MSPYQTIIVEAIHYGWWQGFSIGLATGVIIVFVLRALRSV